MKICKTIVGKRKTAPLLALILVLGLAGYLAVYPTTALAYATDRQLPIYCVDRGTQKICSISFDAAWGNEDTQTLIDILERYKVKTTFFVVGDWVEKYPESVKALKDAGHEVMSHSAHHDHYNSLTAQQIAADLKESCDKTEAVTGVRPTLIRPPYGEYDDHVIQAIREFGMEPIQWDVDSLDWKDLSAADITARVTSRVQPGSIVLFHNAAKHTPEALPGILEYLISQGYSVVPISQLIHSGTCGTDFTIDHTGKQLLSGNAAKSDGAKSAETAQAASGQSSSG